MQLIFDSRIPSNYREIRPSSSVLLHITALCGFILPVNDKTLQLFEAEDSDPLRIVVLSCATTKVSTTNNEETPHSLPEATLSSLSFAKTVEKQCSSLLASMETALPAGLHIVGWMFHNPNNKEIEAVLPAISETVAKQSNGCYFSGIHNPDTPKPIDSTQFALPITFYQLPCLKQIAPQNIKYESLEKWVASNLLVVRTALQFECSLRCEPLEELEETSIYSFSNLSSALQSQIKSRLSLWESMLNDSDALFFTLPNGVSLTKEDQTEAILLCSALWKEQQTTAPIPLLPNTNYTHLCTYIRMGNTLAHNISEASPPSATIVTGNGHTHSPAHTTDNRPITVSFTVQLDVSMLLLPSHCFASVICTSLHSLLLKQLRHLNTSATLSTPCNTSPYIEALPLFVTALRAYKQCLLMGFHTFELPNTSHLIHLPSICEPSVRLQWLNLFNLSIEPIFTKAASLPINLHNHELSDTTQRIINPHQSLADGPKWVPPEKRSIFLMRGNCEYFHYNQDNCEDAGWGCCYRSLQTVISWYKYQHYTDKPTPTHWEIQRLLKEKDLAYPDLTIGQPLWIGTVEGQYILNWYLSYECKIFYLQTYKELVTYTTTLCKHFTTQGTPILMGVGSMAFVMVGICVDKQTDDVFYLILDPHYVGEESIKILLQKHWVSWKKIEFFQKTANGKFINLCCPLLSKEDGTIAY